MNKRTTAVLGIAMWTLVGCASIGEPVARHEATHEWVATDRVAQVTFTENEVRCSRTAESISGYESCMAGRGYELYTP